MLRGMAQVIPFEERAVAALRNRLGAAESANEDLIAFARGHSGATAAIHGAVLALMEAKGLGALFDVVRNDWPGILGVDHVALAIIADGQGFRVHQDGIELVEPRLVDRVIADSPAVTMRTVERGHALFGKAADGVRSEALILLSAEAPLPHGLLLLGQKDDASLDNRHGAQLLGFLGSSLAAMIHRCLIDN